MAEIRVLTCLLIELTQAEAADRALTGASPVEVDNLGAGLHGWWVTHSYQHTIP